jgi:hypothetical protein
VDADLVLELARLVRNQSTGASEADIVGNASNAALYTFFNPGGASLTDGTLGFRLRLGADDNPAGFKHIAVVGLDIDADFAVDVLLVVDNKGGTPQIAIRPVTGDGTTPGQTAIDTSSGVSFTPVPGTNYDWRSVSVTSDPGNTSTDIDADGKNDYFLSFSVDFQQLVNHLGGAIDETSSVSYVAGTSTNSNSVNQDWAGPQGLSTAVSRSLELAGRLQQPRDRVAGGVHPGAGDRADAGAGPGRARPAQAAFAPLSASAKLRARDRMCHGGGLSSLHPETTGTERRATWTWHAQHAARHAERPSKERPRRA